MQGDLMSGRSRHKTFPKQFISPIGTHIEEPHRMLTCGAYKQ